MFQCVKERDLGLMTQLANEWEQIWTVMQLIGVNLKGVVVVADVYNNLCYRVIHNTEVCWFLKFWRTKMPIKIILFFGWFGKPKI